jgi:hypothetical protein
MRPNQPAAEPQEDLFRARLQSRGDLRHALVRLAGLSAWDQFETVFGGARPHASKQTAKEARGGRRPHPSEGRADFNCTAACTMNQK